jgi:hypothetical protein
MDINFFKKDNMSELVLLIVFIIYLLLDFKTPDPISGLVDSLLGKLIISAAVIYMFMKCNTVLAVLGLLVAFNLIRHSSLTGLDALQKYAPTEEKKMSQFTAFNQFPYTLEQEMVKKMAPIVRTGTSIFQPTYKPQLDNSHDAQQLNQMD